MSSNSSAPTGYVRIPTSALPTIELSHLTSGTDPTIAGAAYATTVTGYTEWVGTWQQLPISLGWDWGVVTAGVVVVLNPNELRTNIQLLSADSRSEPPARARAQLLHWIESIPWREIAIHDLLRGS
jgi:hypothetical protein